MYSIAKAITGKWWLLALEGVFAIVFGVIAWVWPDLTVGTLVILFGAFAFVSGVSSLIAIPSAKRKGDSPWGFLFQGVLSIGAGVAVALWPDISALTLLYVIGAYAVATGVFEIATAIELRKLIDNEWLLALAGIGSIAFGTLVMVFPGAGAVALVWTIGIYAVAFGILLITLGFKLHGWGRHLPTQTA